MSRAKYRHSLPQLSDRLFLTDGGIETTLVFLDGIELPYFAAFDLLKTRRANARSAIISRVTSRIATAHGAGFVLESPTWRANADWGGKLGYSAGRARRGQPQVDRADGRAARRGTRPARSPMVISGCVGPRGDGYDPGRDDERGRGRRTITPSRSSVFRETEADMVTAITMTNAERGDRHRARRRGRGMPVAISFTVETDGRLPTGQRLQDAIAAGRRGDRRARRPTT